MRIEISERGFEFLEHEAYPPTEDHAETRLASQSSVIDHTDRGLHVPGSSFLWIGDGHHLGRDEVFEFALRLLNWYYSGSLDLKVQRLPDIPESPGR